MNDQGLTELLTQTQVSSSRRNIYLFSSITAAEDRTATLLSRSTSRVRVTVGGIDLSDTGAAVAWWRADSQPKVRPQRHAIRAACRGEDGTWSPPVAVSGVQASTGSRALGGSSAAAVVAATLSTAAPAQKLSPAVIAVVDTQRLVRDCNACKTVNTQLQQQVEQLRTRAQQLGTPLQTEEQALQTAVGALNGKEPDAALKTRITNFQTQQNNARQEIDQRQQTIERNRQYVNQQVNQKVIPIIHQVAGTRGASIVLDANDALDVSPNVDVTADVLALLNQQLTTINTVAPAAPAQAPAAQNQGR